MVALKPIVVVVALAITSLLCAEQHVEQIVLTPDGKGFILKDSQTPFHPWGVNYGNAGRLIEDFWDDEWRTIVDDFRKIRDMDCNVARVHLQVPKFMDGPDRPNAAALEQLGRLVELAEQTGLYLDLTGLASYRPVDRAAWYDALDDEGRWEVQTAFWRAGLNSMIELKPELAPK